MPASVNFVVQRAVAADIDRVMEIERESTYGAHWTRAAYEKYESEPWKDFFHRCMLVAVIEKNAVGFAAASYLEGDDTALLENLAVDLTWRRRGVAKAMCTSVSKWAKSEGAVGLSLEVRASNEAALSLYASLQFVEQGRRKRYYSGPEEDGVLMGLLFP